ncbi:hypothetical protein IMZ48_24410, partial [Candidatus Bathyarchaeota archaeon]|nr:hypothetical protein [Candidatus Bathyarchaeota archaeon]
MASPQSPASKTSFDSSLSERGRVSSALIPTLSIEGPIANPPQTRTRDSTSTVHSDTIPTIFEPTPMEPTRKHSNNTNVYTTCGRHTDQFLFGGPSLGDMARSLLRRSRSRRTEE